jgi:hypothetical protein
MYRFFSIALAAALIANPGITLNSNSGAGVARLDNPAFASQALAAYSLAHARPRQTTRRNGQVFFSSLLIALLSSGVYAHSPTPITRAGVSQTVQSQETKPLSVRAGPKDYLNQAIGEEGGVDAYIEGSEELRAAAEYLGEGLHGEQAHDFRKRLAKAYWLYSEFKDQGLRGYKITADGKDMEAYFAPYILAETKGSWASVLFRMLTTAKRAAIEKRVYQKIREDLSSSSEFKDRFVRDAHERTISPPMAYILLGPFMRYFEITDEVILKKSRVDGGLLLEVKIGAGKPFLIDLRNGRNTFFRNEPPALDVQTSCLMDYPYIATYAKSPIGPGIILSHIRELRTFNRLADILAEYFFASAPMSGGTAVPARPKIQDLPIGSNVLRRSA